MKADIVNGTLFLIHETALEEEKIHRFLAWARRSAEEGRPIVLGMLDMSSAAEEGKDPYVGLYLEATKPCELT